MRTSPPSGRTMTTKTLKSKRSNRGQRNSAAWGKRLGMILLLVAGAAFAQTWEGGGHRVGKFDPDLAPSVTRVHQGLALPTENVKVIVQYKQSPQSEQE